MITLPHLYMLSSRKDKNGRTARSVLEAQHSFVSLAVFDPRSAEPLPRPMTNLLDDIAKGVDGQTDGLRDRLWRICDHCGQSLASLFRTLNEEPRRVHERMHVRQVRELDIQSFGKLSMRPGFNIRQKLASDPHLNAPRHVLSFDISENRLLKACAKRLAALLESKSAAFPLSTMEEELLSRIDLWLHSEAALSISTWTNLPPNNALLSHRDYRRIWDAWGMLDRIDEEVACDWENREDIACGIEFWKRLSALRSFGRTLLAEVPLVFDIAHLTIRPFDGVGIPAEEGRSRASDSSLSQGSLILYGGKLPAPKRREVKSSAQHPFAAEAVCIDFVSPRPWFSTDGKATSQLRRIFAWQRWSVGGVTADVGCFKADAVWLRKDAETINPLDVFLYDVAHHSREAMDVAFRSMMDHLHRECFNTETLIWLVPDFLDDWTIGTARRAINSFFPKSEPLPRSIAAVLAFVKYDEVNDGDAVLVIDHVGGVVSATKLVAEYDMNLANSVPETHGFRWTRYPSAVLRDEHNLGQYRSSQPSVDENGVWMLPYDDCRFEITSNDKQKARSCFPGCKIRIRADQNREIVCGGHRAHGLQQVAGNLAIWRDKLPALSIGNVIVGGMYGNFVLVDPTAKSIAPVLGKSVPIKIDSQFVLPKKKTSFPLRQGEGKSTLAYVAELDFPAQTASTSSRLDLRYTYGADEPYTLDFIPCENRGSLPVRIRAKWTRRMPRQCEAVIPYLVPSFPELKSWKELRNYPKKNGSGTNDLIEWAMRGLDSINQARYRHGLNDPIAFVAANQECLGRNLFNVRFPLLTIMQGGRSLSSLDFPNDMLRIIQNAEEILAQCVDSPALSASFKHEALQVLSYFHSFAPPAFLDWAIGIVRSPRSLGENDNWRPLAFCLGDASQPWQSEICRRVLSRLSSPANRGHAICILSVAAWRSSCFLDNISSDSVRQIMAAVRAELKRCLETQSTPLLVSMCMELLLALLRVNGHTGVRYASDLRPGTRRVTDFVDMIDSWTKFLHERKISLPFRVRVEVKKPAELYNTPDFLYALRCYLTGDDGANAISITSVDEGDDTYDDKD